MQEELRIALVRNITNRIMRCALHERNVTLNPRIVSGAVECFVSGDGREVLRGIMEDAWASQKGEELCPYTIEQALVMAPYGTVPGPIVGFIDGECTLDGAMEEIFGMTFQDAFDSENWYLPKVNDATPMFECEAIECECGHLDWAAPKLAAELSGQGEKEADAPTVYPSEEEEERASDATVV